VVHYIIGGAFEAFALQFLIFPWLSAEAAHIKA